MPLTTLPTSMRRGGAVRSRLGVISSSVSNVCIFFPSMIQLSVVVGGSSLTSTKLNDCISMAQRRASHVRLLIESASASVQR